jgi:adenylyl-sulfate kinase
VVWLTGLSGAGKTTIAYDLVRRLNLRGHVTEHLDGDEIRQMLFPELGFTRKDRETNIARIAWVASRIARAGACVVVSVLSPYASARAHARTTVEALCVIPFLEVYVCTPLDVCIARDPKGLYAQALSGHLPEFTGISAPYEQPQNPDLRLDTTDQSVSDSTSQIISELDLRGLIISRTAAALMRRE